ncbi:hypothetical protein EDD99_8082 [Streptomyces sp. 846.5]|nr:hypothetical protein [Streptomyces sp. 846.5]TDT94170.1 hypothetical protein EDD99_8082 [Streptomyces sp. 846.5]
MRPGAICATWAERAIGNNRTSNGEEVIVSPLAKISQVWIACGNAVAP